MRSKVLAAVLAAGLAGAVPAFAQGRGGGHSGGTHSGGSHGTSGHVSSGHASSGHASGGHTSAGHANGGRSVIGRRGPVGRVGAGTYGGGAWRGGGEHGRWDGRGAWRGHGWGGRYGWRGGPGWAGLYLTFPLWWNAYSWWGSPYGGWWPYPWDGGYYGYVGADPDAGLDYGGGGSADAGEAPAPAAGPSPVVTDVSPPDALVLLNGVLIGSADEFDGTPDYLYLDSGRYALEFRRPGYRGRTLTLEVHGEARTVVSLELEPDPSAPAGAAVAPPGLPYGRTFSPDFGPSTAERPRPRARADAGPASDVAALRVHVTPPNAAVYLDGVLLGTGEEVGRLQRGVAVAPGRHTLEVLSPDRAGRTVEVRAVAGQVQDLTIELP